MPDSYSTAAKPRLDAQDYFCEQVWAFDVSQTKHCKKKNIHNTFSRENKKKKKIQSDNLFEVFHINLERQEIGIFYIDGSSSGNTN